MTLRKTVCLSRKDLRLIPEIRIRGNFKSVHSTSTLRFLAQGKRRKERSLCRIRCRWSMAGMQDAQCRCAVCHVSYIASEISHQPPLPLSLFLYLPVADLLVSRFAYYPGSTFPTRLNSQPSVLFARSLLSHFASLAVPRDPFHSPSVRARESFQPSTETKRQECCTKKKKKTGKNTDRRSPFSHDDNVPGQKLCSEDVSIVGANGTNGLLCTECSEWRSSAFVPHKQSAETEEHTGNPTRGTV